MRDRPARHRPEIFGAAHPPHMRAHTGRSAAPVRPHIAAIWSMLRSLSLLITVAALAASAHAQGWTVRTVDDAGASVTSIDVAEALLASQPTAGTASPDALDFFEAFPGVSGDDFVLDATGVVDVLGGTSATVTLYVDSDDGFRLRLNGAVIGEVAGVTGASNTTIPNVTLHDGDVLRLTYFENVGGARLTFRLGDGTGPLVGAIESGIDVLPYTRTEGWTVRTVDDDGTPVTSIDQAEALLASRPIAGTASFDVVNLSANFPGVSGDGFAMEATGVVDVIGAASGTFTLRVYSDDGFRLRRNGVVVAESPTIPFDGLIPNVTLADGDVLRLTYFENGGGEAIVLQVEGGAFVGNPASGIAILPASLAASRLGATRDREDRVRLTWDAAGASALQRVNLYRRPLGEGEALSGVPGDLLATASATGGAYEDRAGVPMQRYEYCAALPTTGAVSCAEGRRAIRPVENLRATSTVAGAITLTWRNATALSGTQLRVYRRALADGETIATTTFSASDRIADGLAATLTTYADPTAEADQAYAYGVVVVAEGVESDAGRVRGLRVAVPTARDLAAGDGTDPAAVRLAWNIGEAFPATGFDVYRETLAGPGTADGVRGPGATLVGTVPVADPAAVRNGWTFSYTDATAAADVYYEYCVVTTSASGESAPVCDAGSRTGLLPPTAVAASDDAYDDRIEVSWTDAGPDETGYVVRRRCETGRDGAACPAGTTTFAEVGRTLANVTRYADADVRQGVTYEYEVAATTTAGAVSAATDAQRDTGRRTDVLAPADPVASDGTYEDRVEVTWSNPSTTVMTFQVYRQRDGGARELVAILDPTATRFTDDAVTSDAVTAYCVSSYTVPATTPAAMRTSLREAAASELATPTPRESANGFTVDAVLAAPGSLQALLTSAGATETDPVCDTGYNSLRPPTGVAASDAASGDDERFVRLTWTDASGAEAGYRVYRWPTTGTAADAAVIGRTGPNRASFIDSTGTPGTAYTYAVRAYDQRGPQTADALADAFGGRSRIVSASGTPVAQDAGTRLLKPASGVAATDGRFESRVEVTWTDNSAVRARAGYRVYRWPEAAGADQPGDARVVCTAGPTATACTDTDFSAADYGVRYRYRVVTYDFYGEALPATSRSDRDLGGTVVLAPVALSASQTYTDRVVLAWSDASAVNTHYVVTRDGVEIAPTVADGGAYVDASPIGDVATHEYCVTAVAGSARSAAVCATGRRFQPSTEVVAGFGLDVTASNTPSGVGNADQFGISLSADPDAIVVGAPSSGSTGMAYFYRPGSSGGWQNAQALAQPGPFGQQGRSVAVDGDIALVGAPTGGTITGDEFSIDHTLPAGWSWQVPGETYSRMNGRYRVNANLIAGFDDGGVHVYRRQGAEWVYDGVLRSGALGLVTPSDLRDCFSVDDTNYDLLDVLALNRGACASQQFSSLRVSGSFTLDYNIVVFGGGSGQETFDFSNNPDGSTATDDGQLVGHYFVKDDGGAYAHTNTKWFGEVVALNGNWAFVGYREGGARVAPFLRKGDGTWEARATDWVGNGSVSSMSSDGNWLAVGVTDDKQVKMLEYDSGTGQWVYRQTLGGYVEGNAYGASVALRGDRLAVGGYNNRTRVYRLQGSTWTHEVDLFAEGAGDHSFGTGVAMDVDDEGVFYLTVGDDQDDTRGNAAGGATVFTLRDGVWTRLGQLLPAGTGLDNIGFGRTVALIGNEPIIGAHGHSTRPGALYFGRLGVGPDAAAASDGTYDNHIQIRWADRTSIESGFRIYRSPAEGGEAYQLIATVGANETIYTDTDAPPGSAFDYCVTAYAIDGDGTNLRESERTCDVGWRPADGAISGRVASAGGAGVGDIEVCLAPQPNRSALFDGQGGEATTRQLRTLPATFTVEAWAKRGRTDTEEYILSHGSLVENGALHLGFRPDGTFVAGFYGNDVTVPPSAFPSGYDARDWNHWAVAVDGAARTVYLNGVAVASGSGTGAAYAGTGPFVLGALPNGTHPFQGEIDEVRVWGGAALSAAQIAARYDRPLVGDEAGLLAYWPLDQTEGVVAPDVSETAAHLRYSGGVYAGEGSTGLTTCRVTDDDGSYAYRGIRYGEGTTFEVRPQADGRSFQPGSRSVALSPESPVQNQVDFTDASAFTFAGRVTLGAGTGACAADSVGVFVDGDFKGTTRADGTYSVSVNPTTAGQTRTLSFGRDGTDFAFAPAALDLAATQDLADLNAHVTTTRTLTGFAGGGCGRSVGRVQIRIHTEDGCFDQTVWAEPTYQMVLAPQAYLVDVVGVELPDDSPLALSDVLRFYDGLGTQRVDLTQEDATLDFVYRAPVEVVIEGLPTPASTCSTGLVAGSRRIPNVPVLGEYERVNLTVRVQERYGPNDVCAIEGAQVQIFDGLADTSDEAVVDTTNASGLVRYRTFGRSPEISSGAEVDGVDRSYQKSLSASVTVPGRGTVTETVWAVVEGYRERTSEFVSATTTEIPLMVLHDPPGSNSYSYVEEGTTSCSVVSNLSLTGGAAGVDIDLATGFKAAKGFGVTIEDGAGVVFRTRTMAGRENGDGGEIEVCASTTERFATHADQTWVGEDLYVGTALNLLFALADDIRVDQAACRLDFSERLATDLNDAQPFATTYVYGSSHIRNTLIPQLETLARLDSTAVIEGDANSDGTLEQIRLAAAAANWQRHLDSTAVNVERAFQRGAAFTNRSFSSGTEYEWSHTVDSLQTQMSSTDVFVTSDNAVGFIGTIVGYDQTVTAAFEVSRHWISESSTSQGSSKTVGYVFSDGDTGDVFSVDVGTDPVYGTPAFRTVSGRSSNPWEAGTLRRDWPELSITPPLQFGVDPEETALFTLNLTNRSESNETRIYTLDVDKTANPHSAVVGITGDPIGEETFTMAPNETISITLGVDKGPGDTYDYDDLALLFYPPAEREIWMADPRQSSAMIDTVRFSVHFTPPCSEVELLRPLAGWRIGRGGGPLQLVADGFELDGTDDQRVGFEYRRNGEPWTLLHQEAGYADTELVYDWTPPGDGDYEVRAFTSCKVESADGTSFASLRTDPAEGVVDSVPPQVLGTPQPADGALALGDDVAIRLTEPVDCASASTALDSGYRALGLRTADGAPVATDAVCQGSEVVIVPRSESFWTEHEGETVTAFVAAPRRSPLESEGFRVLGGLRDGAGNPLADAAGDELRQEVVWSFVVRQSALRFSPTNALADLARGEPGTVTARLRNTSETDRTVELSGVPAWLTPRVTAGLERDDATGHIRGTLPGGGELPFTFDVDPALAQGRHRDTLRVDALAPGGARVTGTLARLFVEAAVGCHAPAWSVASAAYENTMQMVVQTRVPTSGDPAATGLDRDADYAAMTRGRVAAFAGGSLRGVADVDDQGRASLQAYSNALAGELLRFELWDEEACVRYGEAGPGVSFTSGQTVGTAAVPADVYGVEPEAAPGSLVLDAGWTWFSLPFVPSDAALTSVLAPVVASEGDLVRGPLSTGETATATYDSGFGVWAGGLDEVVPGRGYQIHLSRQAELARPDGASLPDPNQGLELIPGWNQLGYLPGCPAPVNEALAGLTPAPSAGDVIRSQDAFAVFDATNGWYGSLRQMAPGEGYLLRAQAGGTLYYPRNRQPVGGTCAPVAPSPLVASTSVAGAYEHAMGLVVAVPGLPAPADTLSGYEVVAFADATGGPEARGAARLVYDADRGEHLAFLTVHGRGADGETVRLRLVRTGEEAALVVEDGGAVPATGPADPTAFVPGEVLGTLALPLDFDGHALAARQATGTEDGALPEAFEIVHGAPNPVRDRATFRYGLPTAAKVTLTVYDVLGRQVARVVDDQRPAGYHEVALDAHRLAAGSYAVILLAEAGGESHRATYRITVVR